MRKHAMTIGGALLFAYLAGITRFMSEVLAASLPVAVLAVAIMVASAAVAVSLWLMGLAVRQLRAPQYPIEIIQPGARTWAADVAPAPQLDYEPDWKRELQKFLWVGNMRGFSFRSMQSYITRPGWDTHKGLLMAARPGPVLATDRSGTRWAEGWSYGHARTMLRLGLLSLPYPVGTPPPIVAVAGDAHTPYTAHTPVHTSPAQIVYRGG